MVRLLPPKLLVKTGPVDHADWNYRAITGAISRRRFKLVVKLLAAQRFDRVLEIGYGSGVFSPELSERCRALYGIDLHDKQQLVSERLATLGVSAHLVSGSVTSMPFEDDFFDCEIAVSTLEFVADLDAACQEISRVLKADGCFIVVTPGHSALVDWGLKVLTDQSARNDFGDRRGQVIPTLLKHFILKRELSAPFWGGSKIRLYTALKLGKRREQTDEPSSLS